MSDVVALLAKLLAPAVAAELARAKVASTYSSLDLPSGVTRRLFREQCKAGHVLGAWREGHVWMCDRDAWHAARSAPRAMPVAVQPASDDAIADEIIRKNARTRRSA